MNSEEFVIIRRIVQGESRLYAQLVDRYSAPVFALIVQMVQVEADAEELTQDTFMKAYTNLNKFKQESSFATWLFRIAYNTALSSLRKPRLMVPMDDADLARLSDTQVDDALNDDSDGAISALRKALEKLTPDERAIITLFYDEDHSIREIAAITSDQEGNVKVKLHRIRRKLCLLMEQEGYKSK